MKYRLLLIEDSEDDYVLTLDYLKSASTCQYEVDWIRSFEKVQELIAKDKFQYDAVLIDFFLGKYTGFDVLQEILKAHGSTPCIILTGTSSASIDLEAMQRGAADYLIKDKIDPSLLDRSIRYSIERRRNERLVMRQQREESMLLQMASLGEMTSEVLHEINNPLTAIQSQAITIQKILNNQPLDSAKIAASVESIHKMIARIIALNKKIKQRFVEFSPVVETKVNVHDAIKEAITLCEDALSRANIELQYENTKDIEVPCQPVELSQVLVNLIINACDAVSEQEKPWIRIEVEELIANKRVAISVLDSGPPINDEIRKKLFNRRYTTKAKGSGLGLNLSRKIIELYGGTLDLCSSSSNTRFVINLPATKEAAAEPYQILIVDDEKDITHMIKDEFMRRGHVACAESSPKEALQKMKERRYDAIVFDIHMPELDGLELSRLARELPTHPSIFVCMSGYVSSSIRRELEGVPVYEKPFNVQKLVDQTLEAINQG